MFYNISTDALSMGYDDLFIKSLHAKRSLMQKAMIKKIKSIKLWQYGSQTDYSWNSKHSTKIDTNLKQL